MKEQILFITGNTKKAEEVKAITGLDVSARNLDIPEIQSLDVEEVAKAKALSAFEITNSPVIVDDTGMSIDSLNGLPGALVAWFLDNLKPEGILKILANEENRKASVCTCIAYADQNGVFVFTGTVNGRVSKSLMGENGFGYDPIFIPDGSDKTYAEMTADEKNEISMRKIALLKFKDFIMSERA
ncbi:MAG TPA: RdgB/HAM1 family non-canonical purine NTP pyrophosphatase [Candidatus Moranbacteria bacterium]|nr:RdgB/HAM1 family non-canonical purine NTP pyrophosphatase [Candidatus Moranbacteria bacterium]